MAITSELGSKIKFFVFGNTKSPQRAEGDAGIDLYMPNFSQELIQKIGELNPGSPFSWGIMGAPMEKDNLNKGVYIYLPAHEDIVIPMGIKARMPENVCLKVANKSGVASNQKLRYGAEIIDSSYEGEIKIQLFNDSNVIRFIEFGQKLAQLVPVMVDSQPIEIFYDSSNQDFSEYKNTVTVEEFYEGHESERKEKGFGEGTGLN